MSASKNNVVEAGAGAAGALVALLVTYPLITLNTRQHVTRRDAGAEGDESAQTSSVKPSSLAALYDGIEPAIVGTVVSQAVYNYWYARANGTYARRRGREPTGAASLAIASFAGCVNVMMTLPIWTIVTRMQANVKKREEASEESESEEDVTREVEKKRRDKLKRRGKRSFFDVAAEIARDGGIAGFWQGLTPSLVMVSNPALQYAFYETAARRHLKSQAKSNLSALEVFCLGAYAKFGATVLTYPLQVIKSRLQVVSKDMADERMRYRGAAHAFRVMARDEGLPAFFRGIETKLAQTILAAALMFTVKEKLAEAAYRRVGA
jgi:adenine nucleotide transporter 17